MSRIFSNEYYDGSLNQWATQDQINGEFRSGITRLTAGQGQNGVAIAKNASDIANLLATLTALQGSVQAAQAKLVDVDGRINANQASTAAALAEMNNTLTAFGKLIDGYAASISAANTTATQAMADVSAIKTYADPEQIKAYFDLTNALSGNIDNLVNTSFLKYWTPEKADMIARLDAVVQQVSAMDTRVSKNAQDIAGLSSTVSQNAQKATADLNDAMTNIRGMFRALQGELQLEQKARCETDKALQAQINNLCTKEQEDVSALTDTVTANAKKAADDLDAAVATITTQMEKDEASAADFQKAQGLKDAEQDGAIETNRKNIADDKTQLDALTATVNTFDGRISGAEKNASDAAATANAAKTATDSLSLQVSNNAAEIEKAESRISEVEATAKSTADTLNAVKEEADKSAQDVADLLSGQTQLALAIGQNTNRLSNISEDGSSASFPKGVSGPSTVLKAGDSALPPTAVGGVAEIPNAGTYELPDATGMKPGAFIIVYAGSSGITIQARNGNMMSLVLKNTYVFSLLSSGWAVSAFSATTVLGN